MSSKLDLLFTHVEVLRSREPMIMDTTPIATMTDGPRPEVSVVSVLSSDNSNPLLNSDTPAKILQVGCEREYGRGPVYKETQGCNVPYLCECIFGEWISTGKSDSKKKAKQIAAKKVLLQIVEKGCFSKFGIPGSDKEEAKNYVLGLMPALEDEDAKNVMDAAKTTVENWPGKCIELCQTSKLSRQPEYTSEEEGLPNDKTFTVTANLKCPELPSDLSAVGVGRSKKLAKNQAARKLYEKIADIFPPKVCKSIESPEMVQTPAKDGDQVNAATVPSSSIDKDKYCSAIAAGTTKNVSERSPPTKSKELFDDQLWKEIQGMLEGIVGNEEDCARCELILKKLLASKHPAVEKVFDCSEMNFIVAEQGHGSGNIQVYLEMLKLVKNQPQNTFAGEGPTEEVARGRACWQALQFLYVFGGFRSGEQS